jgi:hypothetical protein
MIINDFIIKDAAVTTFVDFFGRLWRVPWENGYKEVVWRWLSMV